MTAQIGAALRKAMAALEISRDDLFITTKISPRLCSRAAALAAVREDVKELGLTPDLVLHHFPCERHHAVGSNLDVWKGLQQALNSGMTRSIGVSNYVAKDLMPLLSAGGEPPALNQCQMSIGSHDDDTIAFCKSHNITYQAYSPLRHLNFSDPRVTSVATAHGVGGNGGSNPATRDLPTAPSPRALRGPRRCQVQSAQVALRWINQQGVALATSPGSNSEYATEDLAIGGFTLTDDEMAALSKI